MKENPPTPPPFPPITLSEGEWLDFFDQVDASDAEKRELIQALWTMMMAFVDISLTCASHPETCGQGFGLAAVPPSAVLDSDLKADGTAATATTLKPMPETTEERI